MFDTLLLRPSLHCNTALHFTTLHPTTLINTSLPLIYTSLPFHLALCIYISCRSISHHITRHSKLISKIINPFTALKNFSPLYFTFYLFYLFIFTYPINPTLHFTLLFLSTTYFPSPHFPSPFTFYRIYFPSLVYTSLTLVLKICILSWEVPIAPSGSLFQLVMVLFTKEYFPISVICFLALIFQ